MRFEGEGGWDVVLLMITQITTTIAGLCTPFWDSLGYWLKANLPGLEITNGQPKSGRGGGLPSKDVTSMWGFQNSGHSHGLMFSVLGTICMPLWHRSLWPFSLFSCVEAGGVLECYGGLLVCGSQAPLLDMDTFTPETEAVFWRNVAAFLCRFYFLHFPCPSSWDSNFARISDQLAPSSPFSSSFFPMPLVPLELFHFPEELLNSVFQSIHSFYISVIRFKRK